MENIKKLAKGFFPYFATPAMIAFLIWSYATDKATNKHLMFDSVEQSIETKKHVESAPNEVDNYKAYQRLDSMEVYAKRNTESAIQSRKRRDSILEKALDISNRNAVTVHEMKKKVDSINKYWLEYLEEN